MLLLPLVQSCNLFWLVCKGEDEGCKAEDHKDVLSSMKLCEAESYLYSIEPTKYYARAFEPSKCACDTLKDVEGAVAVGDKWFVHQNKTSVYCVPSGQETCKDITPIAVKLKADGTPDESASNMLTFSTTLVVIVAIFQFFV